MNTDTILDGSALPVMCNASAGANGLVPEAARRGVAPLIGAAPRFAVIGA